MISVIVPTIWKAEEIFKMLPLVLSHKNVGEVIIVDNAPLERNTSLPSNKKLKMLEQKQNIFVNPAWNYGVKYSKFDKICLMSDDIIFDERVFDMMETLVTSSEGVFGVNPYGIKDFFVKSPIMCCDPIKDVDKWDGFGTLMFVHKKNYLPIPNELKIYWGDTWIYDYNAIQGRQNYFISKFCVQTKMRTSSSGFMPIISEEEEKFQLLFDLMYFQHIMVDEEDYKSPPMVKEVYRMIKEYA